MLHFDDYNFSSLENTSFEKSLCCFFLSSLIENHEIQIACLNVYFNWLVFCSFENSYRGKIFR